MQSFSESRGSRRQKQSAASLRAGGCFMALWGLAVWGGFYPFFPMVSCEGPILCSSPTTSGGKGLKEVFKRHF